jgi:hypothetical protein
MVKDNLPVNGAFNCSCGIVIVLGHVEERQESYTLGAISWTHTNIEVSRLAV